MNRSTRAWIPLLLISLLAGTAPQLQAGPRPLTVNGEEILVQGQPTRLIGLRCSNALMSDAATDDLLAALDAYRAYGLNTISVYLMGSRFGDVKGYLPNGSLNPVYRNRLERLLQATGERDMVMIVGCLYWGTSRAKEDLSAWTQDDANRAIAHTARWLREKDFTHVILDPDNEGMAARAMHWQAASYIEAAQAANPKLVVANNTRQTPPNADLHMHFGPRVEGKPWLDSEATPGNAPGAYWGRYSKQSHQADKAFYNYSRIGRYTADMKQQQLAATREQLDRFNGYVLASTWLQCGRAENVPGPFTQPGGHSNLGSNHEEQAAWNTDIDTLHPEAGIRWWLEFVRDTYGPGAVTPTRTTTPTPNKHPNVLLLCIDDLRPELACFGKSYMHTPNIDRLGARGRIFLRHYVQAPTCGASRYALLTGQYGPYGNGALFNRGKALKADPRARPPSLPALFRQQGYTTVSVGKVTHHPGGRGGSDWDDDTQLEMPLSWDRHLLPAGPWQHPRGAMHGLAHGEIRVKAGEMDLFQSVEGPDTIYPDGLITEEALHQLDQLARAEQPFFLAVGIIRPHLPFGAPAKYMEPYREISLPPIPHPEKPAGKTTWHRSGEFMKYNRWGKDPNQDPAFAEAVRKHYAACVTYADAQAGKLLDRLKKHGVDDETIVVLWGDHGWHLGEHAIWGKHALFEEALRSPLIIHYPGMIQPGATTRSIVETIDLFPTLADLAGLPMPDTTDGVSLRPILENPEAPGHTAVSYTAARTIRTDTHRLIVHPGKQVELYDHTTPEGESRNIAEAHPEKVKTLLRKLDRRRP